MSRIAVIDADLIGRKKHRFPNLACMKLSGYHKAHGDEVVLKTDYEGLEAFDQMYLSKVFTDTDVPEGIFQLGSLIYGGTRFYYDKAPVLPDEVEHHMSDYHLYDRWVQEKLDAGAKGIEYRFYLDYSIGFLTWGCFRKCGFCVNRNYDRVCMHSPLEEFLDLDRKKICLLDDNFLGHPKWEEMLQGLKAVNKPFQFRQGLDERLLDDRKCAALFSGRYDETYRILPYFWIPEENMNIRVRRDHVPYDVWAKQRMLMTTEGNVIHYGFIENFIDGLGKKFHIKEIAFDRWGAVQMVQNLEGLGFLVVPFGQGFKDMSPPSKELMKLTLEQKLAHGGHPVLRWMMDNIFVRTDPAGNIKPDKEKSTEKIDGAVAAIMALDRAIRNGGNSGSSVYDDRGILVF